MTVPESGLPLRAWKRPIMVWPAGAAAAATYALILRTGMAPGFDWLLALPTSVLSGALILAFPLAAVGPRGFERGLAAFLAVAAVAVTALALAGKWRTGLSTDVLVAGLFPVSDSFGYYRGALALLHTGALDQWATRRPFNAATIASLFALTGGSLRVTLAVLAGLATAGSILAAAALRRWLGLGPAVVGAGLLFVFLFPSVGTLMSENLGVAAAGCGFALLLPGARDLRPWLFAGGLSLLSFGLVARAGAMFVLPALVLYAGWRFRKGERFAWRGAALALAGAAMPFALNALLGATLGTTPGAAFSNFAYTLYGLVTGGHDWQQLYRDFPSLETAPYALQTSEAYRLALIHLAEQPLDLLVGVAIRYNEFFINTDWLGFVRNEALRAGIGALLLVGLWRAIRRRRNPEEALVLAATLGVWASVPFIGDGGPRIRAATVPFTAALVALGAAQILSWLRLRTAVPDTGPSSVPAAATVMGGLILVLLLTAIPAAGTENDAGPTKTADCAAGERTIRLMMAPGAWLEVAETGATEVPRVFTLPYAALRHPPIWPAPDLEHLRAFQPPVRIGLAVNRTLLESEGQRGSARVWLIALPGHRFASEARMCAVSEPQAIDLRPKTSTTMRSR